VRALLIDEGRDRASLVAARELIAAGWSVGTAAPIPSLASRARGVEAFHLLPGLEGDGAEFATAAVAAMADGAYEVVFPAWEDAVLVLAERREELAGVLPFAGREVLLRSTDKGEVTRIATEVGLDVPRTVVADPAALAAWEGPLVLKPASHFCSAERFPDAAAAAPRAAEIAAAGVTPLAQELVAGELMAFAAVADRDGKLVSVSQQRAEHVWPTEVGVTARGVTIPIDPVLRERVAALIERLGWFGLFQIQFLVVGDRACLIDFNGRWYGSMALAIKAGADHPATWAGLALGLPVSPSEARPGVRYQWLTRDLRASLHSERPARELVRALALTPRAAHSLWSSSEPGLAPRFFLEQTGRALRRRL
jgi:ATP-grasp domain